MANNREMLYAQADLAGRTYGVTTDNTTNSILEANTNLDKLESLATARKSKLNNLQSKSGIADSLTPTDLAHNTSLQLDGINKDQRNDLTAEELQFVVGDYLRKYQVHTNEDGSKYKFALDDDGNHITGEDGNLIKEEFTGNGRNLYIDNTKNGDMKLGLARDDKGFTGRYIPDLASYIPGMRGYGWSPGEDGVTPEDGALLDVTLDYQAATDLEKIVHNNAGQIRQRSIGDGAISTEDAERFGSGKTEYTKGDAPLWNADYVDSGEEFSKDTPMPGDRDRSTVYKDKNGDYVIPDNASETGYVENLGRLAVATPIRAVADVADAIVETGGKIVGDTVRLFDKESTIGDSWDLGDGDARRKAIYEFVGHDSSDSDANVKLIDDKFKELAGADVKDRGFVDKTLDELARITRDVPVLNIVTGTVAILNKIGSNMSGADASKIFGTALSNPATAIESIGDLVVMAIGNKGAGMASSLSKTKSAINASKASKSEKIKAIAAAKKDASINERLGSYLADNAGIVAMAAGIANTSLDEFEAENGRKATYLEAMGTLVGNSLMMKLDFKVGVDNITGAKTIVKEAMDMLPNLSENMAAKVAAKITQSAVKLGYSGAKELFTEIPQEAFEATGKYNLLGEGAITGDKLDEAVTDIATSGATGGALGFGSGVHMATPATTVSTVKPAVDYSREVLNDKFDSQSSTSDNTIPNSFVGLKNRWESVGSEGFVVDDTARDGYTGAVVKYAAELLTTDKIKDSEYFTKPTEVLTDLVEKVANIHNVTSTEGKEVLAEEIITKVYSQIRSKDSKTGQDLYSEAEKKTLFDKLSEKFKGNRYASKALEEELKRDIVDRLDVVRERLKSKGVDPIGSLTEDELNSMLSAIGSMKTFGSESLNKFAADVEKALVKTHDRLGSEKNEDGTPVKLSAKDMDEVSADIETLGFVYEGRSFKSLRDHRNDLEMYVAGDDLDGVKAAGAEEAINSLEVFANNRGSDKINAIGKDRELRSVGSVLVLNKRKMKETQELLRITKDTLKSTTNEDYAKRLEVIVTGLSEAIADHKEIAQLAKDSKYASFYSKIAGKQSDIVKKKLALHGIEDKVFKPINENIEEDNETFLDNNDERYMQLVSRASEGSINDSERKELEIFEKEIAKKFDTEIKEEVVSTQTNVTKDDKPTPTAELKETTKAISVLEKAKLELEKADKAVEQALSGSRVVKGRVKGLNREIEEAAYQYKLVNGSIKNINNSISKLRPKKAAIKNKLNSTIAEIRTLNKAITKVKRAPVRGKGSKLQVLRSIIKRAIRSTVQGLKILVKHKETLRQAIIEGIATRKEVNRDLSKAYAEKKKLHKAKIEAKRKLDKAKKDKELVEKFAKDSMDKAKEQRAKAIDNMAENRRAIEASLDGLVIANNSSELSAATLVGQNDMDSNSKVEFLMEFMPKVIKDSEEGTTKVSTAIDQFSRFSENRGGVFVKQGVVTNDSDKEAAKLNPLLDIGYGTPLGMLFTNENRLVVKNAMNMASVLTLNDMIGMKLMPGEMLPRAVDGAFKNVINENPEMKEVTARRLQRMVKAGEIVPEATFAMAAGREFIKQLEIRLDTKELINGQDSDDMTLALGYLVINNILPKSNAKDSENVISRKVVKFDETEGSVVISDGTKDGKGAVNKVIDLRNLSPEYLSEIGNMGTTFEFIGSRDDGMIRLEPKTIKKGTKTRNSTVGIPDSAVVYLNDQAKKPWKFSDSFERLWNSLEGNREEKAVEFKRRAIGTLEDAVARSNTMTVQSTVAGFKADELAIDRMLMAYDLAGERDFYIDWGYIVSGRNMMDNKMINPQSNSLSRFVVGMEGMSNTINKENISDGDLYAVKAAMAQAFDLDIDKNTDDVAFKKLDKLVEITNIDGKLSVKYPKDSKLKLLVEGEYSLNNAKWLDASSKSSMHIWQAIDFLKMANDDSVKKFDSNLALEADGITNGMSSTLMQMGWNEFTERHLERTGVYGKDSKFKSHGEFKQAEMEDVYQAPIPLIQESLGEEATASITEIVGSNWRNFMKNPVMIFIYGSGMDNIVKAIASSLVTGNSYIRGGLAEGKLEELKKLAGVEDIKTYYKKYDIDTGKFISLRKGDIGYGDKDYLFVSDSAIAKLTSGIEKKISEEVSEGFQATFSEVVGYRRALKMVEEVNYAMFKAAFQDKLVKRGVDNKRLGEVTKEELDVILDELKAEGVYYSSKNAAKGEGEQDFYGTGTMEGTEEDVIKVRLSPSKFQSAAGVYATINKVIKDVKASVGSVGVINIHNIDGTVMLEGHITDVLNVYDALVLGTDSEANDRQIKAMNQAFYDISIRHSILGNAVSKLVKNAPKFGTMMDKLDIGSELLGDFQRIFEMPKDRSLDVGAVKYLMGILDKVDTDRRQLAKEELVVNQYYVVDNVDGIKGTTDASKLERHAVFSNDEAVADKERIVVAAMFDSLIKLGSSPETAEKPTKKAPTKGKYGTISKETLPEELNKLVDGIQDVNVKKAFKSWLDTNLKEMEMC